MNVFVQKIEEQLEDFENFKVIDYEGDIQLEKYCNEGLNYIKRHIWCEDVNNAWLAYYVE